VSDRTCRTCLSEEAVFPAAIGTLNSTPPTYTPTMYQPAQALDAEHLAHQREWSRATFGPGSREKGISDHIRKELVEVEDATSDAGKQAEWIDVVILALDGAGRSGLSPQQIIDGVKAKQARNEARTWPDWRTADPDKAIEHDRSLE
jgi:hypothetical protein